LNQQKLNATENNTESNYIKQLLVILPFCM